MHKLFYLDILTFIFIAAIILYILIKARSAWLSNDRYVVLRGEFDTDEQYVDAVIQTHQHDKPADYYLYKGNDLNLNHKDVEAILLKYYTYYRNLNDELKFKFFDRLTTFMHEKYFLIYSDTPFKEMPVLISAAAVQISFGLDDFELPHYKYIRVHKEEYFADDSLCVLAGNVKDNYITLAWNQLLKGYYNYEDGNNVGLHEMAHALYFQEMVVTDVINDFDIYFNQLMDDGTKMLNQKNCPHNLYTSYAFSNLQEFWAVSVELFFEKTTHLSTAYPVVYDHLKNILKQNPLTANEPVYHS